MGLKRLRLSGKVDECKPLPRASFRAPSPPTRDNNTIEPTLPLHVSSVRHSKVTMPHRQVMSFNSMDKGAYTHVQRCEGAYAVHDDVMASSMYSSLCLSN